MTAAYSADDLRVARDAAFAGAKELTARYRAAGIRGNATTKTTRRDLVTDADGAAERAVLAVLSAARPGDAVIAEESAAKMPQRERTWIVDPLDGTVNYAHGIPVFCVSVGLVVAGQPVVGVIEAPLLGERFEGMVGGDSTMNGATLNGDRIHVSETSELADALLATGFAYDIENLADDNLGNFARIAKRARGVRRLGSAALDLAYVAAGRFDGFWELYLGPWDAAAGAAIVLAAGGRVSDMAGGSDFIFGRHLLATNGAVHADLLAALDCPSFVKA